jgi:hypothetical protein
MEYPFYKDIMQELLLKLNYEDNQILMARDYCDNDMRKQIIENNPIRVDLDEKNKEQDAPKRVTLGMLKSMGIVEKDKQK